MASPISHLGSVRALASPVSRVKSQRRACLSSLSTTWASSLSFSFFSSTSVFASGAKSNLLAIGRPGKILHAALSFGQGAGFAALCAHGVDLLLFVAV